MTSRPYLGACIAAIFIAGCQGAGAAPQTNARPDARAFRGAGSWISPAAKQKPLIYTPDSNLVYIYTYSGQQVGLLQGFSEPDGVCSDSQGDVYVTDIGAQIVYEYARGGTLPINVIDDSGQYPNSCAVDPTSGSLAVANDSSHANVLVFPPGSFTVPTAYTAPNMDDYEFCGYDSAGNLYVDGYGAKSSFQLAELPKGGDTLVGLPINELNNKDHGAGGLQWDGQYVAVEDSQKRVVYRIAVSGSQASIADRLRPKGIEHRYAAQFSIQGKSLLFPLTYGRMAFYKYPQGGRPTKGFISSVGSTITVSLPPT
jgi:DNA-binding beta-propeller fold protein YncE